MDLKSALKIVIRHVNNIKEEDLKSEINDYINTDGQKPSNHDLSRFIDLCFPKHREQYSFTSDEIKAFAFIQRFSRR